jgi:hypothetical protein
VRRGDKIVDVPPYICLLGCAKTRKSLTFAGFLRVMAQSIDDMQIINKDIPIEESMHFDKC